MDRKTKESCKCVTLSLKKIIVSCHERTIIPEPESIFFFSIDLNKSPH